MYAVTVQQLPRAPVWVACPGEGIAVDKVEVDHGPVLPLDVFAFMRRLHTPYEGSCWGFDMMEKTAVRHERGRAHTRVFSLCGWPCVSLTGPADAGGDHGNSHDR